MKGLLIKIEIYNYFLYSQDILQTYAQNDILKSMITIYKQLHKIKLNWWVMGLLLLGVVYKIAVTWNGNFIFQMDNARDWVDVRNMIELTNVRLTGPISAVEGLFNGPFWYYLLAFPYLLSGGNPYSGILLMIFLWAFGGYFLYMITKQYGFLGWFGAQLLWFGSPYIGLTTVYSFNPNPILFLFPVFIYYLAKYLEKGKLVFGLIVGALAGFFFNLEMLSAVFLPAIIVVSMLVSKKLVLFKKISFWLSIGIYILFLLPQVLFDLKHQFVMTNATLRYLQGEGGSHASVPLAVKFFKTWEAYINAFMPTFINTKWLVTSVLWLFLISGILFIYKHYKRFKIEEYFDRYALLAFVTLVVTFLGFWLLPVGLNSWHFGPIVGSTIILFGFLLKKIGDQLSVAKFISFVTVIVLLFMVLANTWKGIGEIGTPSNDPSNYANTVRAIDYAYTQSNGQNFKAYAYLPSVIDYPYQYLFWWYGLKKYGYTPLDYAYLPGMPEYIADKAVFNKPKEDARDSQLTILIKEPDRIGFRDEWEGNFAALQSIDKRMLGPLEVETRIATSSAEQ